MEWPDGELDWRPKIVNSTTLDHVDWNAIVVREVGPDEVPALSSEDGRS